MPSDERAQGEMAREFTMLAGFLLLAAQFLEILRVQAEPLANQALVVFGELQVAGEAQEAGGPEYLTPASVGFLILLSAVIFAATAAVAAKELVPWD